MGCIFLKLKCEILHQQIKKMNIVPIISIRIMHCCVYCIVIAEDTTLLVQHLQICLDKCNIPGLDPIKIPEASRYLRENGPEKLSLLPDHNDHPRDHKECPRNHFQIKWLFQEQKSQKYGEQ
jgi:hypothetical protein